jgi:hypothetical protein
MTIQDAINRLSELKMQVGSDIEVFFDCPKCKESFTPSIIATIAIHFEAENDKKRT